MYAPDWLSSPYDNAGWRMTRKKMELGMDDAIV